MRPSHLVESSIDVSTCLDADVLSRWPLPVDGHGDKYTRGTVLVVGGSPMTPGAVILAGIAALRMGAGRLQIATAEEVAVPVAIAVPEAMVLPLAVEKSGALKPTRDTALEEAASVADAIVIGPGMLPDTAVPEFIDDVLRAISPDALVVLDAIALTTLTDIDAVRSTGLRDRLLMTPNKQEAVVMAGDLSGTRATDEEVLAAAARVTGGVLSSFGVVQLPVGRRWRTSANPPGLGTSGSGDVLAGLMGGAAARCGDREQAACWATFAHVEAALRLGARGDELSFLARELLDEVPGALQII